jgi:hypothetical protein
MTQRDKDMNKNWSVSDQSIKASTKTSNPEEGLADENAQAVGKEFGYTDPHQEQPQGEAASWMGGSEREGGATTQD